MVKIAKFGGSSLATTQGIKKCCALVTQHQYDGVIVSATGNTTRQLLQLMETHDQAIYRSICRQHIDIAKALDPTHDLLNCIQSILTSLVQDITKQDKETVLPAARDHILSYGEMLSATLFSHASQLPFADSRHYIKTDNNFGAAHPKRIMSPKLPFVTQGFIGATKFGETTTLGFEGSDYSAALITATLNAKRLDIWTDVPGIFPVDPHIVSDAVHWPFLSYNQMRTLAQMGAKVLHHQTMTPLQERGIPFYVLSRKQPSLPGTCIHHTPTPYFVAISRLDADTITTTGISIEMLSTLFPKERMIRKIKNIEIQIKPGTCDAVTRTMYNAFLKRNHITGALIQ